ncbi:hypothetical protein CRG98_044786 [Punica granatum]|uniref:Uncharacterized protein n=1 Tax=Punica granatum TaxID=22663 RepID=A0A2I0HSZ6_PUNGR|nr:hypothetical protein CRG98_044786 [Punica granatum]
MKKKLTGPHPPQVEIFPLAGELETERLQNPNTKVRRREQHNNAMSRLQDCPTIVEERETAVAGLHRGSALDARYRNVRKRNQAAREAVDLAVSQSVGEGFTMCTCYDDDGGDWTALSSLRNACFVAIDDRHCSALILEEQRASPASLGWRQLHFTGKVAKEHVNPAHERPDFGKCLPSSMSTWAHVIPVHRYGPNSRVILQNPHLFQSEFRT